LTITCRDDVEIAAAAAAERRAAEMSIYTDDKDALTDATTSSLGWL